jgi:hypothetical protein
MGISSSSQCPTPKPVPFHFGFARDYHRLVVPAKAGTQQTAASQIKYSGSVYWVIRFRG